MLRKSTLKKTSARSLWIITSRLIYVQSKCLSFNPKKKVRAKASEFSPRFMIRMKDYALLTLSRLCHYQHYLGGVKNRVESERVRGEKDESFLFIKNPSKNGKDPHLKSPCKSYN